MLGVMNSPDQDVLIRAVEDARRIFGGIHRAGAARCDADGGTTASGARSERGHSRARSNKAAPGDKAGGMI
jgi:hypothetical protein